MTRLRAFCAAAVALVTACSGRGDATAPDGRPLTGRIALSASIGPVASTAGSPATLRVAIAYLRATGDSVPLGVETFALTDAGAQQLPVTLDLTACLRDAGRRRPEVGSGGCVVQLDLALLSGTAVLDRQSVTPVTAVPGQTTAVNQTVSLYTVARVTVTPPGSSAPVAPARLVLGQTLALTATAVDAAGAPVTSRTPRWASDSPAVATVDSLSGLVTPHAPGLARVTAVVGGRTGTMDVRVVPPPTPVTVASGAGSGTVTSQPAGITCQVSNGQASGTCSVAFAADSAVTLTATPAAGSSFARWGGDCATAGAVLTCQVTPSVPRSATVTFLAFRSLAVTLAGTGSGTVTSAPAGLSCTLAASTTSGTCSAPYVEGGIVTLSAVPTALSTFEGWGGACTGSALTCTVALTQTQAVSATFVQRTATVIVALADSGAGNGPQLAGGSVLQNGAVVCTLSAGEVPTSCPRTFPLSSTVTFTAAPDANARFVGWSGPCAGTGACQITVSGDVTLRATFAPTAVVTVTSNTQNNGSGTVVSSPAGLSCNITNVRLSGTCTTVYPAHTTVVLTATPVFGSRFVAWGGPCAAQSATCTLPNVTNAINVDVQFGPSSALLTIALDSASTGVGQVTNVDRGLSCSFSYGATGVIVTTGTCAFTYNLPATVLVRAQAASGSTFVGWAGVTCQEGRNDSALCTVTPAQSVTVKAQFNTVIIH